MVEIHSVVLAVQVVLRPQELVGLVVLEVPQAPPGNLTPLQMLLSLQRVAVEAMAVPDRLEVMAAPVARH
jgi:hypothetical protein